MTWPLLIFDLDGTLIDSATDIASALNKTLTAYNKPALSNEVITAHIGEGLRKLLADFFPEYKQGHPDLYAPIENLFLQHYEEEMYKTTRLFPGVLDFFQAYQGPVGIVTNKYQTPAQKIIHHLGLGAIPWVAIFGADSLGVRKPDPRPLLEMLKLARRTNSAAFMIGDGIPDMVAAEKAQIPAIAVRFGYTKLDILQNHRPVAVLNSYAELHNMIQELINR